MLKFSPYTYKSGVYYHKDRDNYYEQLIYPKSLDHLIDMVENKNNHPNISNIPVSFRNIPFGISSKKMTDTLGEARHSVENIYTLKNYEILFFREPIGDFKAVIQAHFINDQFFMGSYILKNLNKDQTNLIDETLWIKYLSEDKKSLNMPETINIIDKNGNSIKTNKGIFHIIMYTSGDKNMTDGIRKQLTAKAEREYVEKMKMMKNIYDNL